MTMKPRIHLILNRPSGHGSNVEIDGDPVTQPMLDAAEDLITTLLTGERPVMKDLYDVCARAFDTTREDAKKRLAAAMYGGVGKKKEKIEPEPYLIGWKWKAHLVGLHDDVRAGRWLAASRTLGLMLRHALDRIEPKP
jgi:hypothetical protein